VAVLPATDIVSQIWKEFKLAKQCISAIEL